jgi:AcrR family transcriptional regulator
MSVLLDRPGSEVRAERSGKRTYLAAEARRAQILECARGVFARRGYHVASIADICEAAGIGRGTLYQYFANKHEVFSAVIAELAQGIRAVTEHRTPLDAVSGAEFAPPKLIEAFCSQRLRRLLEAVFVDEASLRLLLREARGLDGGIDAIIQSIDRVVLGALVDDLTSAHELGVIDCPDPALTAEFVLGGVEKMVLRALEHDEPVDLDAIVRVATHIQLNGLLSQKTRARADRSTKGE